MRDTRIAIIGAGNIGTAIANGLLASGHYRPDQLDLTRRKPQVLFPFKERGATVGSDNRAATRAASVVVLAVEPRHADQVLDEIAPDLVPGRHVLISVITGLRLAQIAARIGSSVDIVRAMPNTAIAVRESMTCLAAGEGATLGITMARAIFDTVGKTIVIGEDGMTAATALGACGVAFFLRAIRAASQGGIEIGFHSDEAIEIAAQTARGAATLLLMGHHHPEFEIDRVTTPKGCTIAGLNQMEHEGFSSAMIKGIVASAAKAADLSRRPDGA